MIHRRTIIERFQFYEIPGTGKFTKTVRGIEVTRGSGVGNGKLMCDGYRVFGMTEEFWRWILVMVVEHWKYTLCHCCRRNVCGPPNSYVEILTQNGVALGGGAFGHVSQGCCHPHQWD